MFQNHIKIALRNLLKNRSSTFTNLAGLVVGMTSALLIWQYVAFEKSYDRFHQEAGRIFRVRTDRFPQGVADMGHAAGSACAGPFLKANFAEIQDFVKIMPQTEQVVQCGVANFREKRSAYASHTFFKIFSFPLLRGDADQALAAVWTACLSESTAKRYFGLENPMGKTFKISEGGGTDTYTVTGVFADMPENSHMKWDVLLSYATFSTIKIPGNFSETEGFWDGFFTYLLLAPGTDARALEQKIPSVVSHKFHKTFLQYKDSLSFALQPLPDIHLTSHHQLEAEVNGDAKAVVFLAIIGGLLLLIAWFNYINLSTARAQKRAREVGIRKAIGSSKGNLVAQFLTEAAMLNALAICLSIGLAYLLMPAFAQLSGKAIPTGFARELPIGLVALAVFVSGTLLSGLYPAFVLSSFQPVSILKGNASPGSSGAWLRKSLVIAQFSASVALLVGTFVVFRQLAYMRTASLGQNLEQTLVVKTPLISDADLRQSLNTFKTETSQLAGVNYVAASVMVPGEPYTLPVGGVRRWDAPETESKEVQAMSFDADYTTAYQMKFAAGRSFVSGSPADSISCMLNERAVSHLGLGSPAEAIGQSINFGGTKLNIVGVLKNFHQQSPKEAFEPVVIFLVNRPSLAAYFSIKTSSPDAHAVLEALKAKWATLFPGNPFDYFFLDELFEAQYGADQRFGQVFGLFALLAVFVSCLGLFGLAAFTTEQRTKEIGIRKVLGASIAGITGLLAKDFLKLVLIAIVIASPIAYYWMQKWLADFACRIDIQWWMFATAGMLALLIAFLTVGGQAVKAALADPVKSLRSE